MQVNSKRVIEIPKGSTSAIITYLDKNNYDLNFIDTLTVKFLGYPQSGWIDLKETKMTKFDFLYKLTTSKAAIKKLTLIPGETYYFFLQEVAAELEISMMKLFEEYSYQAYRKDGNILADTYYLPMGMDEKDLIKHLLDQTQEKYKAMSMKIFGMYDKTDWYDKYITIASIIQKESASKEEMPLVSSVIYNRLKNDMKLQMDGTLNYGLYSHTKVTPEMIKTDTSEYNTYLNNGLPKNPVCAVEIEAIKSAIFPAKTKYLYFMKKPDGSGHYFTQSYKEHRVNIKKVQNQIKKIKKSEQNNKPTEIKRVTVPKKAVQKEKEPVKKSQTKTENTTDRLKNLWN